MITPVLQSNRAAWFILAGMMTLGFSDNLVRVVSTDSSLWQFHLIRGLMVIAALLIAAALGAGAAWPFKPLNVLGRSALQAGAMLIYFGCLAILPIGVVVAGLFTAPLFVLIIGVVFQGKRVGVIRGSAVGLGFIGALLVIRPDPNALDLISFLPVLAGLLYAIGAIATRTWCEGETTLTLTLWFFAVLMLFGAIGVMVLPSGGTTGAQGFALRGWMPVTVDMLGWYVVLAIGAVIGIGCIFKGYQIGEAGSVAVFEYTLLVFASFWAWMLWGETVPALGLVGMGTIAAAGIIIAVRSDA
tara:strand:+ start:4355 stop:5254 length:900 start_codon:yes stop_codon:yes gene_type:complete